MIQNTVPNLSFFCSMHHINFHPLYRWAPMRIRRVVRAAVSRTRRTGFNQLVETRKRSLYGSKMAKIKSSMREEIRWCLKVRHKLDEGLMLVLYNFRRFDKDINTQAD